MEGLREQGREVSRAVVRRQAGNMREALRAMSEEKRAMVLRKREEARLRAAVAVARVDKEGEMEEDEEEDALFPSYSRGAPSSPQHARPSTPTSSTTTTTLTPTAHHHHITPTTTSALLLPSPSTPPIVPASQTLPSITPSAYALYKHLHAHAYFLSPGLRFGCQYMAYPGDPLRFHSHFLCRGYGWEEEIELLDLVGGGRLGTGVKKGFLIGGLDDGGKGEEGKEEGEMRTFCIEWGGM